MIFWAHGELRITEILKSPSTMYWIWQVLSGKPCFQLSISNDFKSETLRHHEGNSTKWITIGFQGPKVETPNITKQRFRLQLDLYAKLQWRPKTLSWPPKFQINSVILIENLEFLSNFMEKKWWKFEFSHIICTSLNGRKSDMPSCTAIAREQEDLPQPHASNLRSTNQLCIAS